MGYPAFPLPAYDGPSQIPSPPINIAPSINVSSPSSTNIIRGILPKSTTRTSLQQIDANAVKAAEAAPKGGILHGILMFFTGLPVATVKERVMNSELPISKVPKLIVGSLVTGLARLVGFAVGGLATAALAVPLGFVMGAAFTWTVFFGGEGMGEGKLLASTAAAGAFVGAHVAMPFLAIGQFLIDLELGPRTDQEKVATQEFNQESQGGSAEVASVMAGGSAAIAGAILMGSPTLFLKICSKTPEAIGVILEGLLNLA